MTTTNEPEDNSKTNPTSEKSTAANRVPLWANRPYNFSINDANNPDVTYKRNEFIVGGLKSIYKNKILPLERSCQGLLPDFEILEAEWSAKPMVLLMGQYSTGKTTFISHLLGGVDFPAMHIGPEPTSDKFLALIPGNDSDKHLKTSSMFRDAKIIKGNSLTVMPEFPFAGLSSFGSAFLDHFQGSVIMPSTVSGERFSKSALDLVKHVTLIDTPGVLSGEMNQRRARSYDFANVAKWFADRADLILLLFDAHKLDISDEFHSVIKSIQDGGNGDKIRCILNKADAVGKNELVRVYGSLMWCLGRIFSTPEVIRVYTGSFWVQPLVHDDYQHMLNSDEDELISELRNLPLSSAERKVNFMVKRIRLIKVHLCLLGYLRSQMPYLVGKSKTKAYLIESLEDQSELLMKEFGFSRGDMPDMIKLKEKLKTQDFMTFPSLDRKVLYMLDNLIQKGIPELIRQAEFIKGTDTKAPPNETLSTYHTSLKNRSASSNHAVSNKRLKLSLNNFKD